MCIIVIINLVNKLLYYNYFSNAQTFVVAIGRVCENKPTNWYKKSIIVINTADY